MRSKSSLFLLGVLILGIIAGFVYSTQKYNFGLDIKGGVRFTYRLKSEQLRRSGSDVNLSEARSRTVTLMQGRAGGIGGVQEPIVASKGLDQVVVELPGVSNLAEAEAVIGSSARLEIYHAKTVKTEKAAYREYQIASDTDRRIPSVSFVREGSDKAILPGTPEYARMIEGWDLILAGQELKNAIAQPNGDGFQPLLTFSGEGARKMERWSRANRDRRENIAAVIDGKVISIAGVTDGQILSDNAVIQGTFETPYVRSLVNLLNSGSLPVDLEKISAEKVDATIGRAALDKMVFAGVIAFAVISTFMVLYYALPGVVAVVALGLYILFTLTVLKLFGATFSLAAIAGFVLSVGMAVDANILVFERVKEELRHGKSLASGIELGFRRALPAIFDSNACTILTSVVLANVGTGPVKGFATTLIIGVIISLFTAITVTRSLLLGLLSTGVGNNLKAYAVERNWFKGIEKRSEERPLQIVNKPFKWFAVSALTILIGLPFIGGFKFNVEFTGGSEAQYSLRGSNLTGPQITENLEKAGFTGVNVKLGERAGGERVAYVTVPPSDKLRTAGNDQARSNLIAQSAGLGNAPSVGYTEIGPTIQKEVRNSAISGVVFSCGLIVVFLAFRFGFGFGGFRVGLRFALSGIGALIHDIFVVIGLAAVVGHFEGWEISALFLTAMLTIIGFSVHDTIVIFDRIRENLRHPKADDDLTTLMNRSITQSFARSINTSGTVIVTLTILLIFGTTTPELKFFVLAMLIGIVSGTFSSIYNASPILYLWDRAIGRKRGEEHTLIGLAREEIARQKGITINRPATDPATTTPGAGGRTYGQVRRRANEQKKPGWQELD